MAQSPEGRNVDNSTSVLQNGAHCTIHYNHPNEKIEYLESLGAYLFIICACSKTVVWRRDEKGLGLLERGSRSVSLVKVGCDLFKHI